MQRHIIKIDEAKCTGCGVCIPNCPEGALQIIDDKARLVGELLCDGLGACIGRCPEGAMSIEEREAEDYDEAKVMDNVVKGGANVIRAHLTHLREHGEEDYYNQALAYLCAKKIPVPEEKKSAPPQSGCPGMKIRDFRNKEDKRDSSGDGPKERPQGAGGNQESELRQWPIQLALVHPQAPYFKDADLIVAADCAPFTYANFHPRFLKGKTLIMFCPKLDTTLDMYLEKLTAIVRDNNIKSITIVHMEVPCCSGITRLVEQALAAAGKNITVKDQTISLDGGIV